MKPSPPRRGPIGPAQVLARQATYLWIWAVSRKLKTRDPHAIVKVSSESQVLLRLRDVQTALDIGEPRFELPGLKDLHLVLAGQGSRSDSVDRVVAAACDDPALREAVEKLLGEDQPVEQTARRSSARSPRLADVKPAEAKVEPSTFEEGIAQQIEDAVYIASSHKEAQDPPDSLTNPERPPSPKRVLALLTIDLIHGYYRAKRDKDEVGKIRHANMIIKASATRFAISRFGSVEGAGSQGPAGPARQLPPIEVG